MSRRIAVPAERLDDVAAFLEREGIPLEPVPAGEDAALAVRDGEREQSDAHTLMAGGWIACPTALAMAPGLGLSPPQLGRLLNFLDVKVKACSLGCFK